MSIKNNITNNITKNLIKKASDEKMIEILATARENIKYTSEGYRILNKEPDKNCIHQQFLFKNLRFEEVQFAKNVRVSEINPALLNEDNSKQKIILFFHGGGYIGKLNTIYSKFMYKLCKLLPDYKILAVEYRTLKENVFPDAYDDAFKAWDYLMINDYNPNNIIIMGDSAGGGLGLALTMRLRDEGILPKAYIGLSPWVNLDTNNKCFIDNELKSIDPLFGSNNVLAILGKMYAGDFDIKDPRISPLYGNFSNLPKMFITYGSLEILRGDIQELYEKASKENDVTLKVYKNCQHDVITSNTKEANIAFKDIQTFINNLDA